MGSLWITLNHSEWLWNTLNHSECLWMSLNKSKSFWITLNHSDSLWMTLNDFEWLWITLNHPELLCMTLNVSESFCIILNDSKWLCMSLNDSEWGSVWAEFLPRFLPSHIWESDVTFVTFFGDKKCDALHLSHFWGECDALAHENILFNLWRFWSHPPEKRHILTPPVPKKFEREEMWRFGWDWNNFFSSRLRFFTYLGSVKREGHLG